MINAILPLFAICLMGSQPAEVRPAPPAPNAGAFNWQPEDLTTISLDDLINRLPQVGNERVFDDGKWVDVPVVMEMRRRIAQGAVLTQAQMQRALTRTGILMCRPRWPEGKTVVASMSRSAWLPYVEITLVPREPGVNQLRCGSLFPTTCGNAMALDRHTEDHQILANFAKGSHRVVFDATMERGEGWGASKENGNPGVFWQGEIALDLKVVPEIEDAVAPVHSERLNTAISNAIGAAVAPWKSDLGQESTLFVFDADVNATPELATTAVSAKVQLFHQSELKAEFPIFVAQSGDLICANSVYPGPVQLFTFASLDLPPKLIPNGDDLSRWSIRLTGGKEHVLDCKHAARYWDGVVEISLEQAFQNEQTRMQGHKPRMYIWMP